MSGSGASRRYILLLYGVLLLFYGGWTVLWFTHPTAYARLERAYAVLPVVTAGLPKNAPPVPFFDLEGVISWSECARQGVDVYVTNPCDPAPYHRVANYSPLLVDMPLEWIGVRNSIPAGLVLDLAFLLLLPFVFRPRNTIEFAAAAAACISHATFYAVERANIDVLVFTMIAAAAMASQKSLRGRLWLYGVALSGALIKYYPLVLGLLAVRERLRVLMAIGAVFFAVMAGFVWWYRPELAVVAQKIPTFHYLSDMFGAGALPLTMQRMFALPDWSVAVLMLALLAGLTWFAIRFSTRLARVLPPSNWTAPDQLLLLCGSIIIASCFVLQTNNSYRAIFLMLAIPGLFSLSGRAEGLENMLRWGLWGAVGLLWAEIVRAPFWPWRPAVWGLFLVRELMWWFEAAILVGIILCFVRQAPAVKEALRRLGLSAPT